jgi:hypothetical protein
MTEMSWNLLRMRMKYNLNYFKTFFRIRKKGDQKFGVSSFFVYFCSLHMKMFYFFVPY